MMKAIFDLDGTIANLDHRLALILGKKRDYQSFYKSCVNDVLNNWCKQLMQALVNSHIEILIVTARPENIRPETEEWLEKNDVPYSKLIMVRPENNSEKDVVLKERWLKAQDRSEIFLVIEDRERCVDMWRREGIPCLQCQGSVLYPDTSK